MDRRERWFNEGAPKLRDALAALAIESKLPEGDFYMCPCCLVAYPKEALAAEILTEEHVPPRRLGGSGIVLTCKPCNNSAGHQFDIHALTRHRLHGFISGVQVGRPLPATMYSDGAPLHGEVTRVGESLFIQGITKQNHPDAVKAYEDALTTTGGSTRIQLREKFTPHLADISWVRSAYLAAFAALGFRYIMQSTLDPIRAQLATPASESLPKLVVIHPETAPGTRQILVVEEPAGLESVLVRMDQYSILIPDPFGTNSCDDLSANLTRLAGDDGKFRLTCRGKVLDWPKKATYLLD
ncbi:hypothetical protein [Streptomyces sp. NRRL F-4428]|uniref:hypothetical protein n=1 Tax=Streptomyces sp. NRRL F-4428 TaxID=1609137 RepID=UPI000AF3C6B2|nr:hypothetical protein [Streptomyces sp. NRRL F-4428]